jgi:hypothetical protein
MKCMHTLNRLHNLDPQDPIRGHLVKKNFGLYGRLTMTSEKLSIYRNSPLVLPEQCPRWVASLFCWRNRTVTTYVPTRLESVSMGSMYLSFYRATGLWKHNEHSLKQHIGHLISENYPRCQGLWPSQTIIGLRKFCFCVFAWLVQYAKFLCSKYFKALAHARFSSWSWIHWFACIKIGVG